MVRSSSLCFYLWDAFCNAEQSSAEPSPSKTAAREDRDGDLGWIGLLGLAGLGGLLGRTQGLWSRLLCFGRLTRLEGC